MSKDARICELEQAAIDVANEGQKNVQSHQETIDKLRDDLADVTERLEREEENSRLQKLHSESGQHRFKEAENDLKTKMDRLKTEMADLQIERDDLREEKDGLKQGKEVLRANLKKQLVDSKERNGSLKIENAFLREEKESSWVALLALDAEKKSLEKELRQTKHRLEVELGGMSRNQWAATLNKSGDEILRLKDEVQKSNENLASVESHWIEKFICQDTEFKSLQKRLENSQRELAALNTKPAHSIRQGESGMTVAELEKWFGNGTRERKEATPGQPNPWVEQGMLLASEAAHQTKPKDESEQALPQNLLMTFGGAMVHKKAALSIARGLPGTRPTSKAPTSAPDPRKAQELYFGTSRLEQARKEEQQTSCVEGKTVNTAIQAAIEDESDLDPPKLTTRSV